MTSALPWKTSGTRLHLPRDLDVTYVVGRMGAVTSIDLWPLFYGSRTAGRYGLARLVALGLLRTFPRGEPSRPAWFSLTHEGKAWVVDATDCDEAELRIISGISRINLDALSTRNRLWASIVLACRAAPENELLLFRPEWELRGLRAPDLHVVPDAQVVLGRRDAAAGERSYMVELDAGTERLAVWTKKAEAYLEARRRPHLYGARDWRVLALVPNERRLRSLARTVVAAGAGAFIDLAVTETLMEGRALTSALLVASDACQSRCRPVSDGGQRGQAAAARDAER